MRIRFIPARDTWDLRHMVLRPQQTLEDCDYPNDRNPDAFHLATTIGEHRIAVASFYKEKHPELKGWIQYRLRGMATHPDLQGQGAGAKLMEFALDHLKTLHADLLWANAREPAMRFYERLGFKKAGERFHIEGIGPHFLVVKRLTPLP